MKISVIGTGALGATHAAAMAEIGHEVVGADVDESRIVALRAGRPPFHEPQLAPMLERHLASGALRFTTSVAEAARFAELHFLCVGTPQCADGAGADLRFLHAATTALAADVRRGAVVAGKSTVPAGTAAGLAPLLADAGAELVWNPEFLREGSAVHDTLCPDRIVLGTPDASIGRALQVVTDAYRPIIDNGTPVIVTDYPTAELAKAAANAFLATKISFANAMADLCDAVGAHAGSLTEILGADPRIGPGHLAAGPGFGGGCLPKDLHALHARAEELGLDAAGELLGAVDRVNEARRARVVARAVSACTGSVDGRHVAVLGAAFKAGTDDVRESPALDVAARLAGLGAVVHVHDPMAGDTGRKACPELDFADSPQQACAGADLVLVLTEWPEFAELEPERLAPTVRRRVVVDGRGILDATQWRSAGWTLA
jgi:UDPglucose 6-dehydrogenase